MVYEYLTVYMPLSRSLEDLWTDTLNATAQDGWRLVTITTGLGGTDKAYATFERGV
jgi:hypothetical protein